MTSISNLTAITQHNGLTAMKKLWTNNRHNFWAIRWAWAGDPYAALEEWQEYKHMTNPKDDRSLTEQILEDYDADIESAFRNPFVRLTAWVRWYPWFWFQGVGDRLFNLF